MLSECVPWGCTCPGALCPGKCVVCPFETIAARRRAGAARAEAGSVPEQRGRRLRRWADEGSNPPTGGRGGYKTKRQCGSVGCDGALACPGALCPGKLRKKGKARKPEPECCIKSEPENPRFCHFGEGVARLPSNKGAKTGIIRTLALNRFYISCA